jgi:hypothetical protein
MCDAYVDYIATGFTRRETISTLATAIPPDAPPSVHEAVDFLQQYNGGPVPGQVDDALESCVLPRCNEAYLRDVHPQATTRQAAQTLFDAVQAGDRETAKLVATANTLARFDPWGVIDTPVSDRRLVEVDDRTYRFQFSADGDYFECTGSAGVIRSCNLIQP